MRNYTKTKASILISAYKAAAFIPGALASIEHQSISNWEVIVVEDGPSDGTDAIVSEFADRNPTRRVVYDQLKTRMGVAAVRNRTIELSEGKAIAFLDADDDWKSDHLANILSKLEEGHVLTFSPIIIWEAEKNKLHSVYEPSLAQIRNPIFSLFSKSFIQTCSCVALPRETIDRVGRFDESLRIGEDRDYWFRSVQHGGSLDCTTKPTCRYVKHSSSSMANTRLVAEQGVKFYEKHRNAACIPAWKSRMCLARSLRIYARLSRSENACAARRMFLRAWREWPLGIDLPLRALW